MSEQASSRPPLLTIFVTSLGISIYVQLFGLNLSEDAYIALRLVWGWASNRYGIEIQKRLPYKALDETEPDYHGRLYWGRRMWDRNLGDVWLVRLVRAIKRFSPFAVVRDFWRGLWRE